MSRVAAAVGLAVLSLPVAATSHTPANADLALTRATLIQLDTRAARERAAELVSPIGTRSRRRRLQLEVGDLLSASAVRNRTIRITADDYGTSSAKLGEDFIPRGVDYDSGSGVMAIAAVSQVLLYVPATGAVSVVAGSGGDEFEFANDVVFDGNGGLIIADQGAETNAQEPRDGSIWRYDLDSTELDEIATRRQLSNPKLLARDGNGVIHFIDGGSGQLVSPAFDVRWDVLYRIQGRLLKTVKVVWDGAGIQATAYDADRFGWHWIVNVGELVRIKGDRFQRLCLPPYPLQFATGLTIDDHGDAMVLDGADVISKSRAVYALDNRCEVTLSTDRKLKGSRGLTHVPAE